jgi:hypothetical protein
VRSFSGSGGAVYLLGDPVTNGVSEPWRPRALLAKVARWGMRLNENVFVAPTMGADSVHVKPQPTTARLEVEEITGIEVATGDELLVEMPFMGGSIRGVVEVTTSVANQLQGDPLLIDDLKEVEYVQ